MRIHHSLTQELLLSVPLPILTICCAVDYKKVQWTLCCDVTEQTRNLPDRVNSKITPNRQKQQQL